MLERVDFGNASALEWGTESVATNIPRFTIDRMKNFTDSRNYTQSSKSLRFLKENTEQVLPNFSLFKKVAAKRNTTRSLEDHLQKRWRL